MDGWRRCPRHGAGLESQASGPVRRVFYFFEHVSRICDERLTVTDTVPPGLCFVSMLALGALGVQSSASHPGPGG